MTQQTYKTDYQYAPDEKNHRKGAHEGYPHINIKRLGKTEVTIIIRGTG